MNDPIEGSQSAIVDVKSDGTWIERRSAKDAVSPEFVYDRQTRRGMMKNSPFIEGSRNQHGRAMDAREEHFAEALIHPVMLAHRYPKRVAVVGGTTETLSEILKHTTVEQVYLFEDAYSLSEQGMGTLSQSDDDQRVHRIKVDHAELPLALHRHSTSAGAYDVIVWTRR
jgi:spermidine synthase